MTTPKASFKTLLSNSSAFQVWVGVDGQPDPVTAALAFIKLGSNIGNISGKLCVVSEGEESFDNIAVGSTLESGSLTIFFAFFQDAIVQDTFAADVQGIVEEILDLGSQGGYIAVRKASPLDGPPMRVSKGQGDSDDGYQWIWNIDYGLEE